MLKARLKSFSLGTALLLIGLLILARPVLAGEPQASPAKDNTSLVPAESSSRPAKKPKDKADSVKPAVTSASAESDFDNAYRIGIEDDLQISVWREPELSSAVTVRPDGMITLPLLNDIPVVGLKTEELQTLLTLKLKAYVNEPQVTVIVRQIKSRKVYIFGEVARQGATTLNARKTVLEALAEAGGLGPFAKSEAIYILRSSGGHTIRIRFSYKRALAGAGNMVLMPGDMIIVP